MPRSVQRIKVHGRSLEGNLEGDSPDREVCVYLPPSYATARNRRYPVIYLLHGFTDNTDNWWGFKPHFISVPAVGGQSPGLGRISRDAQRVHTISGRHVFKLGGHGRLGDFRRRRIGGLH
jgi:hypothetical protein